MGFPRSTHTEQLDLQAAAIGDVGELFPIMSDAEGWWFEPESRHAELDQTRSFVARAAARWAEGLSYWTVRELESGRTVGIGGAQRHASGCWNLSYRIATEAQGRGYATELAEAARAAAVEVDPDVPVVAWVLEHNTPSRRVAERIGLTDQGPHVDANDGQTRLAYADRPVGSFFARSRGEER